MQGRSIPDTCGNCNDWTACYSGNNTWKRTVHPCHSYDCVSLKEEVKMSQKPVKARNPYIKKPVDFAAHDLGSHSGLFCNRHITASTCHDQKKALTRIISIGPKSAHSGFGEVFKFRKNRGNELVLLMGHSREQGLARMFSKSLRYPLELIRRFTRTIDYLRKTVSQSTVGI